MQIVQKLKMEPNLMLNNFLEVEVYVSILAGVFRFLSIKFIF
jgi:hypothetical protein